MTSMGMKQKPDIQVLPDGSRFWSARFDTFRARVYVPEEDPTARLINYGFKAPYLLIFEETEQEMAEEIEFAERSGLASLAREYSGSVVFIRPTDGDWEQATENLFTDLIAASAIRQDYEDGLVQIRNRFTGEMGDWQIRGAIFRTFLFGFGASADYIARCCMKTLQGEYLWGPGEITPTAVILERLGTVPAPERRDIPVISVNNPEEMNRALEAACDQLRICEKADYQELFTSFLRRYKRWCGRLEQEEDLAALGMTEEPGILQVRTSADNRGDFAGTKQHGVGYVAWVRHELLRSGEKLPLVMAFHGGGDSAFHIGWVSGWWRVAMRNDFLLIAVDNHLNCSATEIMDVIKQLKDKYPIDEKKIYATGFSMGGCKTWDLFQEYPAAFAAMAPMSATFEVGKNQWDQYTEKLINRMVPVPLFYAAGEVTPLPEMPCQAEKCTDRIAYVFGVNQVRKPWVLSFAEKDQWEDPLWGMAADRIQRIPDPSRGSVLTLHEYDSLDGRCRTVLADISGQGHECREHTCEYAWRFMSGFSR